MTWGNLISNLSEDEVVIKVSNVENTIESADIDKVLITSFDDGTNGIYFLSLKNKVRIWVTWKKTGEQK